MFFYEGRTIRGLGFMGWALLLQLGAVIATGVTLAVLAALIGPALVNAPAVADALLAFVAAVCGIELVQVACGVIFLVGFADAHKGRNEYGLAHARAMDRATLCIVAFSGLTLFSTVYTVSLSLFGGASSAVPAESVLIGNLLLGPLGALVAGLGLYFIVRGFIEDSLRARLRAAVVLGVAGAALGPILVAFPPALNPRDLAATVTGLLASAVAGNGLCALSLLLFLLLFRETRRNLVAGNPPPSLPRYVPVYPWAQPAAPAPVPPPGPDDVPRSGP